MKNLIISVISLILSIGITQNSKADIVWTTSDTIDVFSAPYGSTFNVCYHNQGVWLKSGPIDDGGWYDWDFPTGSKSTYIIYYDPLIENNEFTYYINHNGGHGNTSFYLNFIMPQTTTQSITLCQGQIYTIGSNTYNTSGTYVDTLQAVNTCDSIITTNLTIINNTNSTINRFACDNFTLNGNTYTTSGTYIQHVTNIGGCDSTITLNVTITNSSSMSIDTTICQGHSITIGSNTYNTTGTYIDTLTSTGGCDSIIQTQLTITPLPSVNLGNDTAVVGSITLNAYNPGCVYIWQDTSADSIYTATTTGTYSVAVINSCATVYDTIYVDIITGLNKPINTAKISVNICLDQAQNFITIVSQNSTIEKIEIYSQDGKQIRSHLRENDLNQINISQLPSGIYFVQCVSKEETINKKFIKL